MDLDIDDGNGAYVDSGKIGSVYYCGDGYTYYINKVHIDAFNCTNYYVRCRNYEAMRCFGKATIRVGANEHEPNWFNSTAHINACRPDALSHLERLYRSELLDACRRTPYESPRRLLNRIAARYPIAVAARVRLGNIRHSMRRARMAQYPNIPPSLLGLGNLLSDPVYRNITSTLDGTDNIYAGTVGQPGEYSMIFLTTRMAYWLRKVKRVFVDGTFVPTPTQPPAGQVYQIVTVVRNHVVPLIQVIMERRTCDAYKFVLQHLKVITPQFRPREVVMDNEKGQRDAWREEYNPIIISCYVHFVRSSMNRAGSYGIKRMMRRDRRVHRLVRSMMAIPFLPQDLIHRGFRVVVRSAAQQGLLQIRGIQSFLEYFARTWLRGWRYETLSVCGRLHRTNNPCESANRVLRTETGLHHPNIWSFINGLRNYEHCSYTDVVAYTGGLRLGSSRRLSTIHNNEVINNLTLDLTEGGISILRFLRTTSWRITNLLNEQF